MLCIALDRQKCNVKRNCHESATQQKTKQINSAQKTNKPTQIGQTHLPHSNISHLSLHIQSLAHATIFTEYQNRLRDLKFEQKYYGVLWHHQNTATAMLKVDLPAVVTEMNFKHKR